jgi:esterase/lipase superfamily enzyme
MVLEAQTETCSIHVNALNDVQNVSCVTERINTGDIFLFTSQNLILETFFDSK